MSPSYTDSSEPQPFLFEKGQPFVLILIDIWLGEDRSGVVVLFLTEMRGEVQTTAHVIIKA